MEEEEKLLFEEINRNSRLSNPVLVEGLKNYEEDWENVAERNKKRYKSINK